MRILRVLLLIIFMITSLVFGIDQYRSYKDRDKNAPIITSREEILHLNTDSTEDDLLRGVSAQDDRDGDVSKSLVVAGKSNFIEEGMIRVDYAAFDSHNNVGTYSRRVIYDDYHSPRFSSKKPLMVLRSDSSYDLSFFRAKDVLDGDISNKIKIISDSAYASDSSSEFPIELEVTNSYGDVEKLNLVLDVYTNIEKNLPYPGLSEYIVYTPVGEEINPESYLIGIRQGDVVLDFEKTNYSKAYIDIDDNDIDYNTPGKYTVTFTLWRSYSSYTESKMIVIVTEDF